MAETKRINAAELDFDSIKDNFKEFLKDQNKYQDFDFEGSNLSVLLDILAYNTHYNHLYTNFALNEVFLDSAIKRDSVVSIAKGIGYVPRSAIAAKANVDVVVTNVSSGAPEVLILPVGTRFISTIDSESYVFTTLNPYTAELDDGTYTFSNVQLVQGELITNTYVYTTGTRVIIPNLGTDLTTLRVKVQESATSSSFEIFSSVEYVTESKFDSPTYYVKEIENGLYEVYFGENVIGKQPVSGNVITLEYIATDGNTVNGARNFSYNGQVLAGGNVSVITNEVATSGKDREDIESIKVNAPNFFSSQNRAVNNLDYKTIIANSIPNLDSISVWGGEDSIPPQYGKVFLSIKPKNRDRLSIQEKNSILSLLKSKMMLAIVAEFKDPEILDIIVTSTVYYNPAITNKTVNEIALLVKESIADYNASKLNTIDGQYRHSTLTSLIDKTDPSILNNITNITFEKRVTPVLNINYTDTVYIYNPIKSLTSNAFFISGVEEQVYLKSNGTTLELYRIILSGDEKLSNVGTIDLQKGIINILPLVITSTNSADGKITFTIIPESYDVVSKLDQIVSINVAKTEVSVIPDSKNYIFTSNRV